MRRVVVTGLGMVTPLACGVEETWSRLIAGQSGAGPITETSPGSITGNSDPVSTTRGGSTPVTTGTTKPSSTSCRCQDVTACVVEGSKLLCPVCVQGQDSNNDGLCDFRYVESMTPTPVSPTRETTASTTGAPRRTRRSCR